MPESYPPWPPRPLLLPHPRGPRELFLGLSGRQRVEKHPYQRAPVPTYRKIRLAASSYAATERSAGLGHRSRGTKTSTVRPRGRSPCCPPKETLGGAAVPVCPVKSRR